MVDVVGDGGAVVDVDELVGVELVVAGIGEPAADWSDVAAAHAGVVEHRRPAMPTKAIAAWASATAPNELLAARMRFISAVARPFRNAQLRRAGRQEPPGNRSNQYKDASPGDGTGRKAA